MRFRRRRESDLDRELRDHLELEAEEQTEAGLAPHEAHFAARRAFGNATLVKEDVRSMNPLAWLETIAKDLRYALRMLRRYPGFSAIAVMALALGIGANTAVFSVFNAALLRPLPFAQPSRLVRLWESYGKPGYYAPVSYPNFLDWRAWNHTFTDMAAFTGSSAVLTGSGEPLRLRGVIASASLFPVLGVQPSLGRRFLPEEDRPASNGGADAIILGHRVWQEHFAGDPAILGRTLTLDGRPYAVVGVMPPGFDSYTGPTEPDYWMTAAPWTTPSRRAPKPVSEERQISFLNVVARLNPGVPIARAQADMDRVAAQLFRAHPGDSPAEGVSMKGMQESVTGDMRSVLLLLLSVAGAVFLIACSDVGGLVLARATGRQREMTVRAAIGAGKWRILRQLLVESLVLAAIGCGVGLWFAALAARLLGQVLGLTRLAAPPLDGRVFGFAVFAATVAAALFSLAPSWQFVRADLMRGLRESALTATESLRQRRLHSGLVIVQIALAMVLLSSSGLLTLSLVRLQHVDLGFQPDRVLTFPVSLPGQRYPQASRAPFFHDLAERLQNLPGIQSAAAGGHLPLLGGVSRTVVSNVAGEEIPMRKRTGIAFASITPEYFRTLAIPIKRGREFSDRDSAGSAAVVIVNEAAARQYFGSRDPVGQQVTPEMWNGSGSPRQPRTIVGIAGDVKLQGIGQDAVPTIYWPIAQIPSDSSLYVAVRTPGNPLDLVGAVREQLRAMDKDLPLYGVTPLAEAVSGDLAGPRHTAVLVALFAGLALVLTAVGLYGMIAWSVARRTHEIGIRMALGAARRDVLRGFLGHGLALGAAGVGIGVPATVVAAKMLRALLFGVASAQPLIFAGGAGLLIAVAVAASYLPARRATRIDPAIALRVE